jgi:hypothetical protein
VGAARFEAAEPSKQGGGTAPNHRTVVRPNFFIVGAAKAGTSALHDCLGRHPQVFMTALKEPNHFCPDVDVAYRVADRASYLAMFEEGAGAEVRGESSVSYLLSESAATRIQAHSPDARILISLRQPADALASLHAEARRWGGDRRADVNDALAELVRIGRQGLADTAYGRLLQYTDQVARYLDVFGRDRVEVVLYEEWAGSPEAGVGSILGFLGVDPSVVPEMRRVHASVRYRNHYVQKVMMTPPKWARRVADTTPGKRWRAAAIRANIDPRPVPEVRDELRRQVTELFREDILRMEALLDRDITSWWYP